MTAASCTRRWQVEAARDGRLVGADRGSFDRHLATCDECRAETKSIEALGEQLRTLAVPAPDQLATRRRRQRLLAEADRATLARSHESTPRLRFVFATLALTAVVLVAIFVRGKLARSHAPVAVVTAPSAVNEIAAVRASEGAKWSRQRDADLERITLAEGELAIDVRHTSGAGHVLVTLPDGELEDLGTRFVVTVKRGRTINVVVHEGLVVLRLDGRAAVRVAAGSAWSAPFEAPVTSACATVAALAPSPPSLVPKSTSAKAKIVAATPAPEASPQPNDFQTAMARLREGDNVAAAAAFASFVVSHPADARTEDAAYLRVVALERAGQHGAARGAALDYLARFPKGFRRREVEAIAP